MRQTIRRILREESKIPMVIARRINLDDLDKALERSLDENTLDYENSMSRLYGTSYSTFAAVVIDDMISDLQFELDIPYILDVDLYKKEYREPLLRYYAPIIKDRYMDITSNSVDESVLKEEKDERKVNLVKKMIYRLYDNISFIEESTYTDRHMDINDKPLLKIYFDSEDTAANIESWFDEKISRDIDELTSGGIVVCPEWAFHWDYRKKNADVYIRTELLKYDNLGNVINESALPVRILRRITADKMEKEFLESFDLAYKLTKKRRITFRFFLEELIYSTITAMMDSFHPIFTNTLPENEFWYDDIFNDLKEHYEERIIKMFNEIMGISN
jgi:hypothetical protein